MSATGPLRCLPTMRSASPARGFPLVGVRAVEQDHHVRVVLDRAGLAQVGDHRPFVLALFGAAVELGGSGDRHAQFLGQQLGNVRCARRIRSSSSDWDRFWFAA
jgi:hypothetical protein